MREHLRRTAAFILPQYLNVPPIPAYHSQALVAKGAPIFLA